MGVIIPQVVTEDKAGGAQVIDGSLRFDGSKSQYLKRTPSSTGNRKTWTWSFWTKRSIFGETEAFFGAYTNSSNRFYPNFNSDNKLNSFGLTGGVTKISVQSNAVFRDTSWYHIVIVLDTTESSSSNKLKYYVNGSLQQTTVSTTPADDIYFNLTSVEHRIGDLDGSVYYDGYMSNVYFIDGQALDASYFGYTDPLTNTWRPKKYTGNFNYSAPTGTLTSTQTALPTYSNQGGGSENSSYPVSNGFDGSASTYCDMTYLNGQWSKLTFGTAITGVTSLVVGYDGEGDIGYNGSVVNSSVGFNGSRQTITLYSGSAITLTDLYFVSQAGNGVCRLYDVTINGVEQTFVAGTGTNSFYLPFDGNSPIGQDRSGRGNNWTPVNFGGSNTIEKATGALPILNTDGGGKVARVGVRTDSSASSLVLALPLVGIKSDFSNAVNSGTSNKTVTVTNAVASSAQSNFYGGSFYFDGSGDYLSVADSNDFAFGSGNFTIEAWIYPTSYGNFPLISSQYGSADATKSYFFSLGGSNTSTLNFYWYDGAGGTDNLVAGSVALNKWSHVAAVRNSNTFSIYIDGVQVASKTSSITLGNSSEDLRIGEDSDGTTYSFTGYMQDHRIYKGLAKYTQNFIPASTDPDILPDTPSGVAYSSNVALVPSTDGAVALDGSGDYMTVASSSDFEFGSGNFTVEFFTYVNSHPGTTTWISRDMWDGGGGGTPWVIYYYNGTINFSVTENPASSWAIAGAGQLPLSSKVWNHVAFVRNGSSFDLYVNGIKGTTGTFSGSIEATSNPLVIGGYSTGSSGNIDGFVSNLHVVKGTALYTSNFTPPTAPITSVANTKLLCCKSNSSAMFGDITPTATDNYSAGVALTATTYTDIGGSNCTITNNGSVTSSSAGTNPFGLTDAANMTGTQRVDIDMGNVSSTFFQSAWTLEMFFKTSNVGDNNWFVGSSTSGNTWQNGWSINIESNNLTWNYDSGSQKTLVSSLSSNTWYFMRVQRTPGSSTALRVWVYSSPTTLVGSFSGTSSDTSTQTNNTLKIGDANGNANNLSANWQFANVMLTAGTVAYQNVPTLSSGVRTDNASVSTQLILNGNTAPSNFNPFTVNINTQRGQESGYCTLNPLDATLTSLSNGNLNSGTAGAASWKTADATIAVSSGKWYWEVFYNNTIDGSNGAYNGVRLTSVAHGTVSGSGVWAVQKEYSYDQSGTGVSLPLTINPRDIMGFALDLDNSTLKFYVNGILVKTFNSVTGEMTPYTSSYGSNVNNDCNFGQKPFKFPPPAGFQPLALANTPRPTIVRPDQFVGVTTYTGNDAASRIVANLGFKPDLVWTKARNQAYGQNWYDSVRGTGKVLRSDITDGELSNSEHGYLSAFNSDGYTMSAGTTSAKNANELNTTYVAWCWKAGGNSNTYNINDIGYSTASAAGLTAGTITPTGASINTKSGFSIITWTGNQAVATIPHGLGKKPSLVIVKGRNATTDWMVIHPGTTATKYIYLNTTGQAVTYSGFWNNTEPTDTVFTTGSDGIFTTSGRTFVAYLWAEIPGFSKFGSFTGSSDLPFIHTGFKPRWLLIKNAGASGDDWALLDSARNTYNEMNSKLWPNTGAIEATLSGNNSVDFLANGFKMRSTNNATNSAGNTMIYACFAETPSFNLYGGQANAR